MGLKRGAVKLEPYNPDWPVLFEKEKQSLLPVMGDFVIEVRHTGSTAIPDMPAKPIIDILVAVKALEDTEKFAKKLEQLGYEDKGNAGVEGRRFFVKGSEENRLFHLSIFEKDSLEWQTHVLFVDYLKKNKNMAKKYAELKRQLAEQFPEDRGSYTAGKEKFIHSVIEKAKQESV